MPRAKDDLDLHKQQQQENTYQKRRRSFIASNDLHLQHAYRNELIPPHPYPDGHAEVKYLTKEEREITKKPMFFGRVFNTVLAALGRAKNIRPNHGVMFTRRGSVKDLMMMEKHEVNRNGQLPLKTNHSSFNQGQPVANAGFLYFGNDGNLSKVKLSSGHYAPDDVSGVKLAEWAKENYAFDPDQVPIVSNSGRRVDVSQQRRVEAVNQWAKAHSPGNRRKSF